MNNSMNKLSKFWYNWLRAWCWYLGVVSLVLMGGAFDFSDEPLKLLVSLLSQSPYELNNHVRFGVGIQGTLTLTLAILCYGVIRFAAHHDMSGSLWRYLLVALLVWFVTDGIISVATQFYLNVLSNFFILVWLVVPLVAKNLFGQE